MDDLLDADAGSESERRAFLVRQQSLLARCYHGDAPHSVNSQEQMLVDLIAGDRAENSGLQSYLRNMMLVMEFDARRRGRLISQAELNDYTRWLAKAVTEAMHYFIGHDACIPQDETRYLAVSAAHITHMLRDTFDDVRAGYYSIPCEVLDVHHIGPGDVHSDAYRAWVKSRVLLAREYFQKGSNYLARVQNLRCRLAGLAYTARFTWLLDTIAREDYFLRPDYTERKRAGAGLRMGWLTLSSLLDLRGPETLPQTLPPMATHRPGEI